MKNTKKSFTSVCCAAAFFAVFASTCSAASGLSDAGIHNQNLIFEKVAESVCTEAADSNGNKEKYSLACIEKNENDEDDE